MSGDLLFSHFGVAGASQLSYAMGILANHTAAEKNPCENIPVACYYIMYNLHLICSSNMKFERSAGE